MRCCHDHHLYEGKVDLVNLSQWNYSPRPVPARTPRVDRRRRGGGKDPRDLRRGAAAARLVPARRERLEEYRKIEAAGGCRHADGPTMKLGARP
jgi:hypothetical protein